MKLRKKLTAGLLAAVMTTTAIPTGISAEGESTTSMAEWTVEDTFQSILYGSNAAFQQVYSDHIEYSHYPATVHMDDRTTSLGALTGDNSLLITADQLKSNEYTDKVCLGFTFSFDDHRQISNANNWGEISVSSVDGSFNSKVDLTAFELNELDKSVITSVVLTLKKEDLQSGIIICLTEEKEDDLNFYRSMNTFIRSGNPLNLRNVNVCNIFNFEKKATLEGFSGDLDALGSITIPSSMFTDYPEYNDERPGALICFDYETKSGASEYISLVYHDKDDYYGFLTGGFFTPSLYMPNVNTYDLIRICDRVKKDGITIKYYDNDSHGAILKSVSIYIPIGVTYPAESGYQSVGESIAALSTGKTVVQKTSVKDGKYDARFVEKVNVSELSSKSKAVFSLSNGTKTSSVFTNKYYTSLTADGETITAESGTVFLVYTLSGIPEDVTVTVGDVVLE